MNRPLVSVVMATYNRAHLLRRSLECYARSADIDVRRDLELVVIDDHSTDDTQLTVKGECGWHGGIPYQIIVPGPKTAEWRDCGAILNCGIRAATGKHIVLTHPEVMPGRRSIAALANELEEFEAANRGHRLGGCGIGLYAACKVYYLSPCDQERIDTVPWREQGVLALRQIEGFYDEDGNGNPDYKHHVTDRVATPGFRIQTWDSWVFGGCSRETWKRLGGMWVTQKWGSVDVGFNHRRKKLGVVEWTCPDDDTTCAHQSHDGAGNVPTPRDEAAWRAELDATDKSKLSYPEVDELGW